MELVKSDLSASIHIWNYYANDLVIHSHSRTYDYFKNQLKTVLKPDHNIMKYLKLNSINLKSTNKSPKDFKL